LDIA